MAREISFCTKVAFSLVERYPCRDIRPALTMAALVITGPSALAQRRGTFAKGHASGARPARAARLASTPRTRPESTRASASGGTTIGADEMAKDASSAEPLIGINPDRVPMVEAVNRGETSGKFNWTKQWYPVAVIDLLDTSKPHPTQLLGKDIVVWKDGAGKWNVFEDKCPHRLAPLSEGRVEDDGTLLCAYHAWRFDGDGKCTDMPQASSKEEEDRVRANPRSCAFTRPCMEAQGLVWAWGEGGKEAELEACMTPPLVVPEIEGVGKNGEAPGGAYRNHWQVRDMPYGWAAFFENAIDPAHAVVSHHTLVGSRYDDPAGFNCVVERPMTAEAGFRCAIDPAVPPFNTIGKYDAETSYDFQPPCLLKIDWRHEEARFLTSHYCVPTRPGWCRHFVATVCQRGEGEKVRQHRWFKLNLFTLTSPAWMTHVLGPTFLHQDMVLLHQQEKIIAQGDGQDIANRWKDEVFIPTSADKMTVMFYQWFGRNGPIPWDGRDGDAMPPIERDQSKLFDTWEMHTKYCTHCQGALRNTEALKVIAAAAAAWKAVWATCLLAFGASAAGAAAGAGVTPSLGDVIAAVDPSLVGEVFSALSLAGTAYGLHGFAGMFRSYPFSHAEEDIVMEGTAKIGLSNDGPSLYIDVVDNLLFGGNKHAGKKCAVGCECGKCSPFHDGIRSKPLVAFRKKQESARAAKEAGTPAR